jgi:ABC-type transport system involved in cytochrome c biogenesis ATPase subunit
VNFLVLPYARAAKNSRNLAGQNECVLITDNWDDFGYKTQFLLIYFDEDGIRKDLGKIKIMRAGMKYGYVDIPDSFSKLTREYASIGQDQEYYENISSFPDDIRINVFKSLRDVIWDESIFSNFEEESAFKTSLCRSVTKREITKFKAIAHQHAELTPFHFKYIFQNDTGAVIDVEVIPETTPPTNIHVIIGRNGVGKTHLLQSISVLLRDGKKRRHGTLTFFADGFESTGAEGFANLITVAFSAFDEFRSPLIREGTKTGIQYNYIGLRKNVKARSGQEKTRAKSPSEMRNEFVASTLVCLRSSRIARWQQAMRILETDPVFEAIQLQKLADLPQDDFAQEAEKIFNAASSGHKIVLLTMTRLIELVSERTLVLIDEPEAHLHPPLVASFIRALSTLLADRNGVALLATHSPVVVQEVPRECVSLFFRTGENVEIARPEIETFAENVGLLTREIFRVQVTESGYHALIREGVKKAKTLDKALETFGGRLGAEGRALARTLWRELKA